MSLTLDDLKNLKQVEQTGPADATAMCPDETVTAIFKVRKPNYVPRGVRLRARIDAKVFTGSFAAGELNEIKSDENVVKVSLAERLQMID